MKPISYLNGLKSIAALLVLFTHMAHCIDSNTLFMLTWHNRSIHFLNADFSVHLFIIISAYLAYIGICKGKRIDGMLLKRYFRLALPIGVVLLFMGLMKYLGAFYCETPDIQLSSDWLIVEPRNFSDLPKAILMSPFGIYYGWMNPLWMMRYVFFAPFIVFLLYKAFENLRPSWKHILVAFLCILLIRFDYYYVDVVLGYAIAEILPPHSREKENTFLSVACILAVVGLEFTNFFCINMLRAFFVIIACANSIILRKAVGCKPLDWLGNISMGVYILHVPIFCTLSSYLLLKLPEGVYKSAIIESTTLMTVIVFAILYGKLIEPFLQKLINAGLNTILKTNQ